VTEIVVEFGSSQPIGALREAAYRLIGEASCLIDTVGDRHICRLTPKGAQADEAIRTRFLDLVTDENLREKVIAQTATFRDVIIALAFGALAREREGS
jgi:His-Xaa-Ser system protein HxsD